MPLNLEYFLTLKNYMKKKVQTTIKFTTFSTTKKLLSNFMLKK